MNGWMDEWMNDVLRGAPFTSARAGMSLVLPDPKHKAPNT